MTIFSRAAVLAAVSTTILVGSLLSPTAPAQAAPAPDTSNSSALELKDLIRRDADGSVIPWGANEWDCKPSNSHPNPVVLVHGYGASASTTYPLLAPVLKATGYCVYALNWGGEEPQPFYGYGSLRDAAHDLATFVDTVLARSGATKVDNVGHSAGGVMTRWYLNKLGGGEKVSKFFAVAPATNGTDVNGLTTMLPHTSPLVVNGLADTAQPAVRDLMQNSDFVKQVNSPSPILPTVKYQVLATAADTVVTPVESQFLPSAPNVTNILLQDICPQDNASHQTITSDFVFIQLVENFLGNRNAPIACRIDLPRLRTVQ